MKVIDLRSDTVTKPTQAMYQAMIQAPLGDDVYGEDPTVNRLEAMAAEMAGMEAAVFTPSGTQSNLMAVMSHCERGDEYIVGQTAHTYRYEGGGAAVLGSVQPQPLDFEADGTLDLAKVESVIKPGDDHFARTRLLCLENTTAGKVLPLKYLEKAAAFCQQKGLALHLDGARIFNAAIHLDCPLNDITKHVDSVSICLSKGLGAPVGSVLCGSKELIKKARRWRKLLGGGMRQAGVLAGAGIYALENNIQRLKDDHINAAFLAQGLASVKGVKVVENSLHTNMFYLRVEEGYDRLREHLKSKGVILPIPFKPSESVRLVTHLDITEKDVEYVLDCVREFSFVLKTPSATYGTLDHFTDV